MRVKEKSLRGDQTNRLNAEYSDVTVSNLVRFVTSNPLYAAGVVGALAAAYSFLWLVMLAIEHIYGA